MSFLFIFLFLVWMISFFMVMGRGAWYTNKIIINNLTANEIHFICVRKYCQYQQHKNAPSNLKKIRGCCRGRNRFALKPVKRRRGDLQNLNTYSTIRVKKFSPILPAQLVYEIHKGWHLYRIHKKADICTSVYP